MQTEVIQIIIVVILSALLANYMYSRYSMTRVRRFETGASQSLGSAAYGYGRFGNEGSEGFANQDASDMVILGNEHLFDAFYAKVYDEVIDGHVREETEVTFTLNWAKTFRPETKLIQALDVGCGTGGAVDLLRKAGCTKAVGLDASEAMIAAARAKYPKSDYKVGEVELVGQFAAAEFNLATMFYFTIYYLRDRTSAFRNLFNWLQPGSCLVIHLVNREKFDPILEAASPFVAFSVQKYSKERVTRSKVMFDKFTYEADFQLEGAQAEFREHFKFKDGKERKQVHHLRMPTMEDIVGEAEQNGFKYKQFIDLTPIGYEYQYLFCFVR